MMDEHNLSRRGFFTATGGISMAAFLAACGSSSTDSTPTTTGAPAGSTDTGAATTAPAGPMYDISKEGDGTITIFEWEGYEAKQPMWDEYTKGPYGTSNPLKETLLQDDQQALAKVAAGSFFDIIHPCVAYTPDWQKAGLIRELDPTLLPHLAGVPDSVLAASKIDGKLFHVPFDIGFSTFAYRTDKVQFADGQESWKVLLDPKYKKRISIFGDAVAIIKIGALINMGNTVNPNLLTQDQIDAAKETMIKALPQIRNFWDTQSAAKKDFIAGNVDICYFWPDGYYGVKTELAKQNITVKYSQPIEGRLAWVCGLVIHAQSKFPAKAHAAISAANSPQAATWLIDNYQYATAQQDPTVVANVVNKDLIKEFSLDDPTAFAPPKAWLEAFLPNRAAYVKAGEAVKAAAAG
jgi:spermidine/putrescine transport system substrate-binding protein